MSLAHRKLSDYLWHSPDQLSKQLKNNIIDNCTLDKLIGLSLAYVEGKEVTHDEWVRIANESYLPIALIENIFGEILKLCVAVLQIPQQSLTKSELLRDLTIIGFPQHQAEKLLESKTSVQSNTPKFPRLMSATWRLEVTISSSALSRIIEPWILLELNLNNGEKKIVQFSLKSYHSLRHQVANCMHQLQTKYKTAS